MKLNLLRLSKTKIKMKKTTLLTFFAFLISAIMYSQVPQEFSYQSVIRDNTGKLVSSQKVTVNVNISSSSGTVYSETHDVSTSPNGLISLNIGSKNPSSFSLDKHHSVPTITPSKDCGVTPDLLHEAR